MFGKRFFDPRKQSADMDGGCYVSMDIFSGIQLKWCVRHKPLNEQDTGWEFYAETDTEETSKDPDNFTICSLREVCEIEPLIMEIFNMPVGTDICLIKEKGKATFVNSRTGKPIR